VTADPKPEVHVDPNFDNQKVAQHEGKVTFSTKITTPRRKPGRKSCVIKSFPKLRRQAMHPPARVTVPDVELTIVGRINFCPAKPRWSHRVDAGRLIPSALMPVRRRKTPRQRNQPQGNDVRVLIHTRKAKPGDVVTYSVIVSIAKAGTS